jgi:hypothetical protein
MAKWLWICVVIIFIILLLFVLCIEAWLKWHNYRQLNLQNRGSNQSIITMDKIGQKGQLGNQLFQLAAAYSAAKDNNCQYAINDRVRHLPMWNIFSESLEGNQIIHNYNIETPVGTRTTWNQLYNYHSVKVPLYGHIINMKGMFEDTRYFHHHKAELQAIFTPNNHLLNLVKSRLPAEYIAIHIRYTDNIPWFQDIPPFNFMACRYMPSFKYYRRGIKMLRSKLGNFPVYICTDNTEWVIKNLKHICSDGQLMSSLYSKCKYSPMSLDFCALYLATGTVISPSTFSWWASYLGYNQLTVRPYPISLKGRYLDVVFGNRGQHQHHDTMIELDYKTGKKVDMNSDADNDKLLTGLGSFIISY